MLQASAMGGARASSGDGSGLPHDPRARRGDPRAAASPAPQQLPGPPQPAGLAPSAAAPASASAPALNLRDPRARRAQQGGLGAPPPPPPAHTHPTAPQQGLNGAPMGNLHSGLQNMQHQSGAQPGGSGLGGPQQQQHWQGGMADPPFPSGQPPQAPGMPGNFHHLLSHTCCKSHEPAHLLRSAESAVFMWDSAERMHRCWRWNACMCMTLRRVRITGRIHSDPRSAATVQLDLFCSEVVQPLS